MICPKFIIHTIASSICLSSLWLLNIAEASGQTPLVDNTASDANLIESQIEAYPPSFSQMTKVYQLRDVQPSDWAYDALRSLVDRYSCLVGYPDQTFQGDRPVTRWEFAAGLNTCLQQIERLMAASKAVQGSDLANIQQLKKEFATELANLTGRVDNLEGRVASLQDQKSTPTPNLTVQGILAVSVGSSAGARIKNPTGRQE